jgi:surface protein
MYRMFYNQNNTNVFNQNISAWNVAAVVTKPPIEFSTGSPLTPQYSPVWVTPIALNGTTIKYIGFAEHVPTSAPLFIQANPRGTGMEWFAVVKQGMKDAITNYGSGPSAPFIPPGQSVPVIWNNIVTTLMTDMSILFYNLNAFNEIISSWDTSNVTNMSKMFSESFNQPIGTWNTSNVTDMSNMFVNAFAFNQPIGSWNTAAVAYMYTMFFGASAFNQPIGTWNTSNVISMAGMFQNASAFNQNISGWVVAQVNYFEYFRTGSALTDANTPPRFVPALLVLNANGQTIQYTGSAADVPTSTPLFIQANPRGTGMEWFAVVKQDMKTAISNYASGTTAPFIPPGQSVPVIWNNVVTTLMTNMSYLFYSKSTFNQPIGSWDTIAVTTMQKMFENAYAFHQPIGAWNTSAVTNMLYMFKDASAFNQPIGTWNTSAVINMNSMFWRALAFNQPIGAWNTSIVTTMYNMFGNASAFNQPIGTWNTAAVSEMSGVFYYATAFNQNISAWNVVNVVYYTSFRIGSALTTENTPPRFR